MKRVKIFTRTDLRALEDEINEFLESGIDTQYVKINLTCSSKDRYVALIEYYRVISNN